MARIPAADRRHQLDLELQVLRPAAFWDSLRRQSPAFWFLCGYFFIEYVRPQQVWPVLDFLPWGMGTLALALVAYLLEAGTRARKFTLLDGGMIFFSAVLLASSIFSTFPDWSHRGIEVYVNWVLIYVLVAGVVTTPRRFFVFLTLFLLWSFKMSQHGTRTFAARGFAFADWGSTGGPGWFHNSGEFAIQMCIFLPMAYYYFFGLKNRQPRWLFWTGLLVLTGTAALSLIASSSRGGQLGGAVVILVIISQSRRPFKGLAIAAVLGLLLWGLTPPEQKERFAAMGEDGTSQSRLTYWQDGIGIMNSYPVLGIGYDAWEPYYRTYYNPRGELPHNIFVEAGSEMGYSGLGGFLFLICGTAVMNRRTRRLSRRDPVWGPFLRMSAFGLDAALIGYLVSGFFVTVLFYPYFWVNLGFTAALYETARRSARRASRPSQGRSRGELGSSFKGKPAAAFQLGQLPGS